MAYAQKRRRGEPDHSKSTITVTAERGIGKTREVQMEESP